MKVRAKIRIVSGKQAEAVAAAQAEAIRELLIWVRQQRRQTGAVVGLVPMAFVGRTSTATAQDPVQSLRKQMRRAAERLPEGFYISRWYWDVESGGTDLDERSRTDVWQQFTAAGLPRDGGMAQLRAAISRRPAAVRGGDLREHRAVRP